MKENISEGSRTDFLAKCYGIIEAREEHVVAISMSTKNYKKLMAEYPEAKDMPTLWGATVSHTKTTTGILISGENGSHIYLNGYDN